MDSNVSNTRLYGASIAIASGLYSTWNASMAGGTVASGWLTGLFGLVVIAHGAVLLTDSADRLGGASGPLMVVYAVVMLLNQALLETGMLDAGDGMDGGAGMGGMGSGPGWDTGMVVLAMLMLASGLIMARGDSADTAPEGM
jgi:hypothetical protein